MHDVIILALSPLCDRRVKHHAKLGSFLNSAQASSCGRHCEEALMHACCEQHTWLTLQQAASILCQLLLPSH